MLKSKIFISYAKEDFNHAKKLYDDFIKIGLEPWIDFENILPGQNWRLTITKAIEDSNFFLTLLSSNSVTKKGYVQKEQKIALEILDNLPPNEIFVIPVRINECEPNDDKLHNLQRVDLFPSYDEGFKKILRVVFPENNIKTKSIEKIELNKNNNQLVSELISAYHNFDPRPLQGESLNKFYIDCIGDITNNISQLIHISNNSDKILITGHRGCGKSTILNIITENLRDKYHIVKFSASDMLNMIDIETADILICILIELILSIEEEYHDHLVNHQMISSILSSITLEASKTGVASQLKLLTFKLKTDNNSRNFIRTIVSNHLSNLKNCISYTNEYISNHVKKDVLIIIDDLDKLPNRQAKGIFYDNSHLLAMIEIKIIFTFPLSMYYSPAYNQISTYFISKYIPVISLYNVQGIRIERSFSILIEIVYKRIKSNYISPEALHFLISKSGGLLRDLMIFMSNGCRLLIERNLNIIDIDIAKMIVQERVLEYRRAFDFKKFGDDIKNIMQNNMIDSIDKETIIILLDYLYILEYNNNQGNYWYVVHPCLIECFKES